MHICAPCVRYLSKGPTPPASHHASTLTRLQSIPVQLLFVKLAEIPHTAPPSRISTRLRTLASLAHVQLSTLEDSAIVPARQRIHLYLDPEASSA